MFDIWGFLLQTLSLSGVAVLLLLIKALFRDKLPPKWQFAVWGVLGIMLLIPVGLSGRYTLFHWQPVIEVIKSWCGELSYTRLVSPFPLLTALPETLTDWVFAAYVLGVVIHTVKYLTAYIRLRLILRKGSEPQEEVTERIRQIAAAQKIKPCRVVEIPGSPSAFVCGIIRPVLVLPKNADVDDKVVLHELIHLKNKDTLLSLVICLMRSLHWCNPLLVYCADMAINDMEARCDQQVLEQLEGEERRDYGRLLLSMANDRFARTPGSTCINNGGKNIRRRIEAIARFKKYPAGMELVSVCVVILLMISLVVGVQTPTVRAANGSVRFSLAFARCTPCTTPAGAFDTYGKAILEQSGVYRAMCAPESLQAELLNEMLEKDKSGIFPNWDCGLNEWPDTRCGYYIYNLTSYGGDAFEGLFTVKLNYPPDGQPAKEGKMYLAVQNLRVEKENGRWVAIPLEDFRNVEATEQLFEWGCTELPGFNYTATADGIKADVKIQTVHTVAGTAQNTNDVSYGATASFDTTPIPDARFTSARRSQRTSCTHLGTAEERESITQIGLSTAPVYKGEERPELKAATDKDFSESNNDKERNSRRTEPGWGPMIDLGGHSENCDPEADRSFTEYYAADLYVNNGLVAEMKLYLQED